MRLSTPDLSIEQAVQRLLRVCMVFLILLYVPFASAEDIGQKPNEILFGMSTALTGPAADLGLNMKSGIEIAFEEANRAGGFHDRQLRLIALDDGYEPSRTAPNMHKLINKHQVIAVIGNVGTPTAVVAVPIANASKTLFFGAYTGAGILRKTPPDRYVINYRASYGEETAAMVEALIHEMGIRPEEIGFFTQRDSYGDAGYVGGIAALMDYGLTDESAVAHGRYLRNTDAVENGLADILAAETPVRAVIMVGAYQPCAKFIKLAKEYELDALFLNVSFVGAAPLAKAIGDDIDGVMVTQIVPHYDSNIPIVQEFRAALVKYDDKVEPSFGALEGYVSARIVIKALRSLEAAPTRENIVEALENLGQFDIGIDQELHLDPQSHQACHRVWSTVIQNGKVHEINWPILQQLGVR